MRIDAPVFRSPHQKFLRNVEEEAFQMERHRVKTRFQAGMYRAVCSCGWVGPARETAETALAVSHAG